MLAIGLHMVYVSCKTDDSELRGQEEAGHTRPMSELFTCSTVVKLYNALNTPL